MPSTGASFDAALTRLRVDPRAGKFLQTGRTLDLAITGEGYFQLRAGDRLVYSRQGGFALAADGRVVTPEGHALQQAAGGDLILASDAVTLTADGTLNADGGPVGRIAIFQPREPGALRPLDGATFAIADDAIEEVAMPALRAGMLEASNVSLGDEMVALTGALRGAETGARLVQVYDELLGKAIGTFAPAGR